MGHRYTGTREVEAVLLWGHAKEDGCAEGGYNLLVLNKGTKWLGTHSFRYDLKIYPGSVMFTDDASICIFHGVPQPNSLRPCKRPRTLKDINSHTHQIRPIGTIYGIIRDDFIYFRGSNIHPCFFVSLMATRKAGSLGRSLSLGRPTGTVSPCHELPWIEKLWPNVRLERGLI